MIKFPAYILSEEPEEIDGLLIIADQIVDDRNMSGETLGMRRLQSPMKSIYPLRYQIHDEVGMRHYYEAWGNMLGVSPMNPLQFEKAKAA